MKHTAQIRVDNPCQESWDRMHPLPGGRFCAHCEKTVVDFSHFTDRQLAAYFRDALPGRTCGRFRADQLGVPSSYRRRPAGSTVGAG